MVLNLVPYVKGSYRFLFIYLPKCTNELLLFLINIKIHRERPFEELSQNGNGLFTHKQMARG